MPSFAKFLATAEPADLGPGPRPGVSSEEELNESLADELGACNTPALNQQLIRSLVLLWHDHLDSAHSLAQAIDNADGAYVHAIMHRREPDYGNSGYWFRRVGRHRTFPELSRRVGELLGSASNNKLQQLLIPHGEWNSLAFVDACEQAASGSLSKADANCLREIQRLEFQVLLDAIVAVDVRRL